MVSPTYNLRDTVSEPPHDSFVWTDETVGEDAARMLTTSGGLRILLWENTREGFYACLSTMDENVDILAMAESTAAGAVVGELAPHSEVVWIQGTQENGLSFLLSSADYSVEELVQIAESVRKQ